MGVKNTVYSVSRPARRYHFHGGQIPGRLECRHECRFEWTLPELRPPERPQREYVATGRAGRAMIPCITISGLSQTVLLGRLDLVQDPGQYPARPRSVLSDEVKAGM